jgi:hypothetical protein
MVRCRLGCRWTLFREAHASAKEAGQEGMKWPKPVLYVALHSMQELELEVAQALSDAP